MITAVEFEGATGWPPMNDDLERVNCPDAGQDGHLMCGWNAKAHLPNFMIQGE